MGLSISIGWALLYSIAFLAALFLFYGFHIKHRILLRHIPGPKPNFLFGNWTKDYMVNGYQSFYSLPKIYGPVYKTFVGTEPRIVITDPVLTHELNKNFRSFHDRVIPPYLEILRITKLGDVRLTWDMIWAKGKYWQSVRGSAEPLFSTKAFTFYQPIINRIIAATMDTVKKDCGNAIELVDLFGPMNLQILGETIFGMDFGCVGAEMSKLGQSATYLMKPTSQGYVTFFTYLWVAFPALRARLINYLKRQSMGPIMTKAVKNQGYIFGAAKALLVSTRGDPNDDPYDLGDLSMPKDQKVEAGDKVTLEGVMEGITDYKGTVPRADSFIAKMLRSIQKEGPDKGKPLSDNQIATNAIGVILAGFETTALGMAYTLFELAKDPVSQAKCRQEVQEFYKERGHDYELVYSDLEHFKYCDAAYHEGMRIAYPGIPPPLGTRRATEDIHLGKWFIPKGSAVIINVNAMMLDEKIWPNPKVFRPERFLQDNLVDGPSTRHPASHSPFGYGARKCVGAKLASSESVFTLVAVFKDFSVSVDPEHHPDPHAPIPKHMGVTLNPINGLWLRFHKLGSNSN